MPVAISVNQVVAGEATYGTEQERFADMVAIASVIANRAAMLGVSMEDVVSAMDDNNNPQFDAYGKPMPEGTAALTDMAQQAIDYVAENGPVNDATFYSTPETVGNLPNGLVAESETTGHQYFSDPAMRSILTAEGYKAPNPDNLPSAAVSQDPLQAAQTQAYTANGLTNGVTSLVPGLPSTAVTTEATPATAVDPSFAPNGLLSGAFPASAFTPAMDVTASATGAVGLGLPGAASVGNTLGNVPASASLNTTPGLSANAAINGMVDNASLASRMGLAEDGFDASRFGNMETASFDPARMAPAADPAGLLSTPTSYMSQPVNNYEAMANAGPMAAPLGVTAQANPMNSPQLDASASVPMSAALFSPAVSQPATSSFSDLAAAGPMAAPVSAQAQASAMTTPGMAASASVPAGLLSSQIAARPATDSFSNLAAASPIGTPLDSGIYSPDMQAMKESVTSQLAGMSPITPTDTSVAAAPSGLLSSTPTNSFGDLAAAGPLSTGLLSGYTEQPSVTPGAQAINAAAPIGGIPASSSLFSSVALENASNPITQSVPASSAFASLPAVANYSQFNSFVPSDVQAIDAPSITPAVTPGVNIAADPAVSMPSLPALETKTVVDQPSVAAPTEAATTTPGVSVAGPVAGGVSPTQADGAAPAKTGLLSGLKSTGLLSGGSIAGGLLGSLAAGPVGGVLGGILGRQISQNGGLAGLLGGQKMSINNIGSGLANVASVYGGAPTGTQAYTSNGGMVTAMDGGWTAYTNKYGVTNTISPEGHYASYFGPSISHDGDSPSGGEGQTGAPL